jgi:hypothetical protein
VQESIVCVQENEKKKNLASRCRKKKPLPRFEVQKKKTSPRIQVQKKKNRNLASRCRKLKKTTGVGSRFSSCSRSDHYGGRRTTLRDTNGSVSSSNQGGVSFFSKSVSAPSCKIYIGEETETPSMCQFLRQVRGIRIFKLKTSLVCQSF